MELYIKKRTEWQMLPFGTTYGLRAFMCFMEENSNSGRTPKFYQ